MSELFKIFSLSLVLTLFACGAGSEDNNLEKSYTFSELIELRMNNDQEINGKTIRIESEVHAYFDTSGGCADDPIPCTDETFTEDDGIPKYQSTVVGPCSSNGFELVNRIGPTTFEKVDFDLENHPEFYQITEEKEIIASFHATIEYVSRTPTCSNQVNYGINITLVEGEEGNLLNQFIE